MILLAQETAELAIYEQGAFQFVVFGIMVIVTYILLKITIAK